MRLRLREESHSERVGERESAKARLVQRDRVQQATREQHRVRLEAEVETEAQRAREPQHLRDKRRRRPAMRTCTIASALERKQSLRRLMPRRRVTFAQLDKRVHAAEHFELIGRAHEARTQPTNCRFPLRKLQCTEYCTFSCMYEYVHSHE